MMMHPSYTELMNVINKTNKTNLVVDLLKSAGIHHHAARISPK